MKSSPLSTSSPKPRQHKNREPSTSRFLSSSPTSTTPSLEYSGESHSPLRRKSSSPADGRRHKPTDDPNFTRHQLWPSSKNPGTLADHITEDRIIEQLDDKPTNTSSILFQKGIANIEKENDRPIVGGSGRFLGRRRFVPPGESPPSPSSITLSKKNGIFQGRFSLDENAKSLSSRRNSCPSRDTLDLECDCGETATPSRKGGVEVPSRYMSDANSRRVRRGTSDSNIGNLNGGDTDSSVLKRLGLKNGVKRANSLSVYKSSKSQWALSPGRSESPAMSVESMDKVLSFSSLKLPNSPTKVKGVEKFLNMGFDLFKSKKSGVTGSSSVGFGGNLEVVHQLRLLDNRLVQWRFANARAQAVNGNISHKAQSNLICAWVGLRKLQHSLLKKKIQLAREILEMKITFVLYSQMKLLEDWGGMERQHASAITAIKECLHSAVCRVPLLHGARVNMQSTSTALRHASDLTTSIMSMLTTFSSPVDKTARMLSELAMVVAQERQLLEEFHDLFQTISVSEVQERSMKSNLVQLEGWQRKYQLSEITS
ncbi:hypothetical protein RJT34_28880 [Clitoria ternatea]|uniref:QWRF motif-containing protein 3 n=1 Tax=Clitoria ternatea TaxID=43366 RepID=A0AAN9IH81_CLITE